MIRARVCVCAVHFFFKFHSSFSLEQFLWSIFEAVESPHRLSIAIQSFRILCVFFSASLLCCCCCCCFYFLLSVKCVRMCVPLCVGVKLLVFFVFDSVSFRAHSQSFRAYCNYMNLFFSFNFCLLQPDLPCITCSCTIPTYRYGVFISFSFCSHYFSIFI